jgi:hypothetical protein
VVSIDRSYCKIFMPRIFIYQNLLRTHSARRVKRRIGCSRWLKTIIATKDGVNFGLRHNSHTMVFATTPRMNHGRYWRKRDEPANHCIFQGSTEKITSNVWMVGCDKCEVSFTGCGTQVPSAFGCNLRRCKRTVGRKKSMNTTEKTRENCEQEICGFWPGGNPPNGLPDFGWF